MIKNVCNKTFLPMFFVMLFWVVAMLTFVNVQKASAKPVLIIDNIICQGNENTDCDFISNKYYQKIGQVLDTNEIDDARLRLGTLIQFKSVNIYLEKGSQRNHVVVVFDVHEASNVQYELGALIDYSKTDRSSGNCFYNIQHEAGVRFGACETTNTSNGARLATRITNFNFLGTGKELSLLLYNNINQKNGDNSLNISESLSQTSSWKSNNQSHNFTVNYYDPYLFGSPYYYLSANAGLNYIKNRYESKLRPNDSNAFVNSSFLKGDDSDFSDTSLNNFNVSLGRRFARHSYVTFNMTKGMNDFDDSVNLSYGWNSEDDLLFPTTGSAFTINNNLDFDENNTSLSYKKHFGLANNEVLTLNGYADVYLDDDTLIATNSGVSARYSSHHIIDKLNGSYSGWYIETGIGLNTLKYSDYDSFIARISAGYAHQTENMIYRLSMHLMLSESK